MTGIYMILCKANEKKYIGRAIDIESRKIQHFSRLKVGNHPCMEMQQDYNTYGASAFVFCILEECNEEKLKHLEDYYILSNHSIEFGYNNKRGDVLSMSSDDFQTKQKPDWVKELATMNIVGYTGLCCLQSLVFQINSYRNANLSLKDYASLIFNEKTKFYVYADTLSGIKLEEMSLENVFRYYDKFLIYVEAANYYEFLNEMYESNLDFIANEITELIHLVINPDKKYLGTISLDEAMNERSDLYKAILLCDESRFVSLDGISGQFCEQGNYKERRCSFFKDDNITSAFVEDIAERNFGDNMTEIIRMFIMSIERSMNFTINDILGTNLKEHINLIQF